MAEPSTEISGERSEAAAAREAPDNYYRKPTQARGAEKFERILDAAHSLIDRYPERDLSLYDIAEEANVATGSVYHFFPSVEGIVIALVERYDRNFAELIENTALDDVEGNWQDLLVQHTARCRQYINAHNPALMLIIGPLRTWNSRQVDTLGDTQIARAMVDNYSRWFALPQQPAPERLLHHAIRILEGFWELSYQQFGTVTDEMAAETDRAMLAYLRLYWPALLPRKSAP